MSKVRPFYDPKKFLAPLTAPVRRRKYLVTDIETKGDEPEGGWYSSTIDRVERRVQPAGFTRPFMVGLYDGEEFRLTKGERCIADALDAILRRKYAGWYIYAHNGGRFDFLHFLPVLREMGWDFELITVGSSIQLLQVHDGSDHAPWTFVDSYKLIPIGLDKATKSFNVQTKKLADFSLDLHEDDPAWPLYLEPDCVGLYQVVEKFHDLVEEKLGGEVGVTAPATAMKTFRRSYLKAPIHRHTEHHDFVRSAYYGGRVEVYRREVPGGLRYYDINSSYPHVMLEDMPVGRCVKWQGPPTAHLRENMIGFARAHVDYPEDVEFPCLPHKNRQGKLLFPVGNFTGTWDAAELFRAEEQGARITWLRSVWYEKAPVLAGFSRALYAYRDKSSPDYDEGLAMVAKILLNSLYGKFGMRPDKEKLVYLEDGEPPEGAVPNNPHDPECGVWRVPSEVDASYIIPQIAAHVTALARLNLHTFILDAASRGTVAYVDTDSIITTADLSHLTTSALGGLKDEGAGVRYHGVFLQPKVYCLLGDDGSAKVTMKGYKSRRREDFEHLRSGGSLTYSTLEKVGTMARAGFKRGPVMKTVIRQIRSEDEKRRFLPDGRSMPLVLRELGEGVA